MKNHPSIQNYMTHHQSDCAAVALTCTLSIGGRRRSIVMTLLLILLAGASTSLLLASHDQPPRISYLEGSAAYEATGDVEWDEATVNLPLTQGDRIFSHPDSRLEIEFGNGNFLRMDSATDVTFPELSSDRIILQVYEGDLILRINDPRGLHVQTPLASIEIKKKGLYRIWVAPGGLIQVAVRDGKAEVSTQHGKEKLVANQELVIDGSRIQIQALAGDPDDFELWSGRRDALAVDSRSVKFVGGVYYPGVYDLDHYGTWAHYGHYGPVWVPHVEVGWIPFRRGRWCHLSFGLTWISQEPWGWLPYHYGRWIYYQPYSRWAWVPGGFNRWRPAHVDFYWGNGYVGWAPRGYYRGRTRVVNNTVIFNNWNPRDRSNGLNIIRHEHLRSGHRGTVRRIEPSRNIVRKFRRGLPREIQRAGGRGRRSAISRANSPRSGFNSPSNTDSRRSRLGRDRPGEQGQTRRSITKPSRERARPGLSTGRRVQPRQSGRLQGEPRIQNRATRSTAPNSRITPAASPSRRSVTPRSAPRVRPNPSQTRGRTPEMNSRTRTSSPSQPSVPAPSRQVRTPSGHPNSPPDSRSTMRPDVSRAPSQSSRPPQVERRVGTGVNRSTPPAAPNSRITRAPSQSRPSGTSRPGSSGPLQSLANPGENIGADPPCPDVTPFSSLYTGSVATNPTHLAPLRSVLQFPSHGATQ